MYLHQLPYLYIPRECNKYGYIICIIIYYIMILPSCFTFASLSFIKLFILFLCLIYMSTQRNILKAAYF